MTIRAKRIWSRKYLNQEINLIQDYAAWNGFPKRTANAVIKQDLHSKDSNTSRSKKANADSIKIFFNLNYSGETTERMVKSCTKELYKIFKREINVKLVKRNTKDKSQSLSQSSVVYKLMCPRCSCNYIGKTE